ncbi:extensin family protein [Oricola cellulosilytica]|uniref:Extensin family protein n=1 Tax=Oricola cellulosilytica TaxID=1429082 RepID=A0A4R0PD07_9HYPH|nr:extensin family protein [Oricola cellulosilytica]TCD15362.1 extensin family protein [Oricola cellulosilytica]
MQIRILGSIFAVLGLVAAADLPDDVPVPETAPREKAEQMPESQPPQKKKVEPQHRPADELKAIEPLDDADVAATANPAPPPPNEAALAICESELKALGVKFKRRDAIDGPGPCGLSATYAISTVAEDVEISPTTEMTCAAARATAEWVNKAVIPSVEALGESVRLKRIRHASTYVCRTRNGQPGAKISEHARGSAIDISVFEFAGRDPIPVEPRAGKGTIEEAFQRAVRGSACLYFTTVLGPGSDAYHDDHLHLDLAERNRAYRLCQ